MDNIGIYYGNHVNILRIYKYVAIDNFYYNNVTICTCTKAKQS